jgi:hypothetical protein
MSQKSGPRKAVFEKFAKTSVARHAVDFRRRRRFVLSWMACVVAKDHRTPALAAPQSRRIE